MKDTVEDIISTELMTENPSHQFRKLLDTGYLKEHFPELVLLVHTPQNPQHHPEGSAWNHTLLVLDEAAKLKNQTKDPQSFMYAALLHDIGKGVTTTLDETGYHSYGHDVEGAVIAEKIMKRITTDKKRIDYVRVMTLHHMDAHKIGEMSDKRLKKLLVQTDIGELLLLSKADSLGRAKDTFGFEDEYRLKVERIQNVSRGGFGKITPYFNQTHLVQLGYTDNKMIADTLKEAYDMQVSNASYNQIANFLKNKITPKKKVASTKEVLDDYYRKHVFTNQDYLSKHGKRMQRFQDLKQDGKLVFKRTSNKVPYIEVISNTKRKFLLTPDLIVVTELNNTHPYTFLSVYEHTIAEREARLQKLFQSTNLSDAQKNLFYQSYRRL